MLREESFLPLKFSSESLLIWVFFFEIVTGLLDEVFESEVKYRLSPILFVGFETSGGGGDNLLERSLMLSSSVLEI